VSRSDEELLREQEGLHAGERWVTPEDLGADPKADERLELDDAASNASPGQLPDEKGAAVVGAVGVTSPDEMPNVLLMDVTPAQLEEVLVELEDSTPTGKEIARRVRAGELHLTLDRSRVAEQAIGLAMSNEVHVTWEGSTQDVAGTLIHEAVHQGDPGLASGAPRSELEATARVAEFEYRQGAGLPPGDSVEDIYRAVLEQAKQQGTPPAEAQARARQAMVDMMRTDPKLYGVEPAGSGGQDQAASLGPALSADPEARARSLESRLDAQESHPDAESMREKLESAQRLRDAGKIAEADSLLGHLERDISAAEYTSEEGGLERNFSEDEPAPLSRTVEYTPGERVPVQLDANAPLANDATGQRLLVHVEQAVARFENEGLTDRQLQALERLEQGGERSTLYDAFRGSRIDEFAKQSVLQDPDLTHLYVTAQGERGADFLDSREGQWYDITTTGAWQDHLERYGVDGQGNPLPGEIGGRRLPSERE
jgi:hypothetical protein